MTIPLHRVRNYEELEGPQGREVFFRPHRYHSADLSPLRAEVRVGEGLVCQLLDVSQNGVAMAWPEERPVSVGEHLARVAVRFDGHEAYIGEARVGSVRAAEGRGATIVPGARRASTASRCRWPSCACSSRTGR